MFGCVLEARPPQTAPAVRIDVGSGPPGHAGSGGPDGSGWRGGQPGRVAASQSALRVMISGKWCERIS